MAKIAVEAVKVKVRYARLVIMEVERTIPASMMDDHVFTGVESDFKPPLPGVYEGIPAKKIGPHVDDVQDYEYIWEVEEIA